MTPPFTLVSAVRDHARNNRPGTGFRFVSRRGDDGEYLSWRTLWNEAKAIAAAMPPMADPAGTGVLIFCDQGHRFVAALLATWMRGATAIPASGGAGINLSERNEHILTVARPAIILHDLAETQANALAARAPQAGLIDVTRVTPDPAAGEPELPDTGGRLLQFTSGSTSAPKPVLLGSDEIVRNCRAIVDAYGLGPDSVGVHWLPLYHDMGLVGSVLVAMMTGSTSVILRPSLFIQSPVLWLQQISQHRAHITSAPNFAFDRLSNMLDPETLDGLDLSSLEAVVMGGEPVSETTVTRLLSRLEPCGLRPRAIAPSYGLAEAVLLVSSGRSPAGPVFRRLPGGEPQACLGAPVDGVTVTIRDGATGASVAAGETGEIWIDGPSCGRVIPPGSDWRRPPDRHAIRTGDIGRLEDGKVFVSGRDADRIILRGRNLFAEEVEDAVRASQVRASDIDGLVAFGAEREGTQVLVVLIERAPRGPGPDIAALNRAVAARLGVKCDRIVQLRRATLPRTSSGKVRRAAARQAFLAGDYDARVLESVR